MHLGYTFFCQHVSSLGIEPTTFALLTQCSTTEPQEHYNAVDAEHAAKRQINEREQGTMEAANHLMFSQLFYERNVK